MLPQAESTWPDRLPPDYKIPIWLYLGRQGYHSKPFQYLCYGFYPVHMLALAVILNYVNR